MPFESPFQTKLSNKPDVSDLFAKGQISPIEMKIGEAVVKWLRVPIVRQLLLYNPLHPNYPFRPDIYIPSKDLIVEVNGVHHYTEKGIEQDKHKKRAINLNGIRRTTEIDVHVPKQIMYWHLKGQEREEMKKISDTYYKGLELQAVEEVEKQKDVTTLATPEVLKSKEKYNQVIAKINLLQNTNYPKAL